MYTTEGKGEGGKLGKGRMRGTEAQQRKAKSVWKTSGLMFSTTQPKPARKSRLEDGSCARLSDSFHRGGIGVRQSEGEVGCGSLR